MHCFHANGVHSPSLHIYLVYLYEYISIAPTRYSRSARNYVKKSIIAIIAIPHQETSRILLAINTISHGRSLGGSVSQSTSTKDRYVMERNSTKFAACLEGVGGCVSQGTNMMKCLLVHRAEGNQEKRKPHTWVSPDAGARCVCMQINTHTQTL